MCHAPVAVSAGWVNAVATFPGKSTISPKSKPNRTPLTGAEVKPPGSPAPFGITFGGGGSTVGFNPDLKTSALQFQGNCLEDDFVVINHQDFLLARWADSAFIIPRLNNDSLCSNSQFYANLPDTFAGAKQFYAL